MDISRHCLRPNLSDRPPQKNAPNIIPRYTMLPGEREAVKLWMITSIWTQMSWNCWVNKKHITLWKERQFHLHKHLFAGVYPPFTQQSDSWTLCTKPDLLFIYSPIDTGFLSQYWYRFERVSNNQMTTYWLKNIYIFLNINAFIVIFDKYPLNLLLY